MLPRRIDHRGAPAAPAPLISWDLVEESLDEAAFLWRQREAALDAPDRTATAVERAIEDRLQGAVDGLCVAGATGVERVLAPALASDEPSLIAVAAHALLAGGTAQGAACFRSAFLRSEGSRLSALRRGLEMVAAPEPLIELASSVREACNEVRGAFIDACSFGALPLEPRIGDLLMSSSPALQRAAARLLRHASQPVVAAWLPSALDLKDRQAREAAVNTGLIAGIRGAWAACRDLAIADIHGSAQMLLPLAISGTRRDHDVVLAALGKPRGQCQALWALGFGGLRAGADACVEVLAQHRHARLVRLAAEAFCAITGLDLRAAGMVAPTPAGGDEPPAFEDDDLDADLVPGAEDLLPAPEVPEVIRWWNRNRARFDPETRYLAGHPVTIDRLVDALAHGPMRRRHAVAFELAMRTRGRFQLETRGFLAEQRRSLTAFASAQAHDAKSRNAVAVQGPLARETSAHGRR